ncbi:MAG TPA: methyltransferase domain-containing protein [Ktedonobacteraceae bacterium]|jgi:ubiquinone/menaquinone biosynthesis C-methylase UbiE|nr:methyltransferase domain-containing protein [Ktedonobacteraceae bacterium]
MTSTSPRGSDERKAQVQDYFSRTAASYVVSATHSAGQDLQRLVEIGEWDGRQHALDIATGGGHTARAIAPYVARVMVTDLTQRMLETAREFLLSQGINNAEFQVADAEHLPFADASFDRVTCRLAAHHFPDVARAVREAARVLKPGGLFLLSDSTAPSDPELDAFDNKFEKWRDPSHGRACTLAEWENFFAQAGLTIEFKEVTQKTLNYDDWTARAQMPAEEKARLERFILESDERAHDYFAIKTRADGHLESFNIDNTLLKGRKA